MQHESGLFCEHQIVCMLQYSVPLKGALNHADMHQLMNIIMQGKLFVGTGSGITIAPAASPRSSISDLNIGKCAQDAFNAHCEDLKGLLSDMSIFGDVAGACKQANIITSAQHQGMFDDMNNKTVPQRVEQFINYLTSVFKSCPNLLNVFLHILSNKGNIAVVEVAKRIAQSCKLSIII